MTGDGRHIRLLIGLGAAVLLLVGKIFSLQLVDDSYKTDADRNSTIYETIYPPAESSTTGTEQSWSVTRLPTISW